MDTSAARSDMEADAADMLALKLSQGALYTADRRVTIVTLQKSPKACSLLCMTLAWAI